MSDKYLTVTEIATELRVSKMTVYRMIHDGRLEALRVGRSFRVHESVVAAYKSAIVFSPGKRH